MSTDDMASHAIELAEHNWQVGPLCHLAPNGKRILHERGKEPVGRLVPHGVLDFTTDTTTVARWWERTQWNIGARVPESMFVLDVDNLDALTELENEHGQLPDTLTTISGRAAGGKHCYFRRPAGKISHSRLPKGVEIKTHAGYVVQPPSIHPDTGRRYVRIEEAVAAPPEWLVSLLKPEPKPAAPRTGPRTYTLRGGTSIADEFTANTSWHDILGPHGWNYICNDPDGDGARWLHPAATSACSATIRNGCLFVYSPNTLFDVTEPGNTRGYTKFKAYAVLNHDGDMSAAAKALLQRGAVK